MSVTDSSSPSLTATFSFTFPVNVVIEPQTITFVAPATGTFGGTGTLAGTGGGSGNPVVFSVDSSSGAGVCQVSGTDGTTLNYTGAGFCLIDANQAGNATYAPAPQVEFVVTVQQAPQSVSFTRPTTGTVGSTASLSATGGASGEPVVYSVDGSSSVGVCSVSGVDGANVTYIAAGRCTIDANQAGNANYMSAPVVKRTISITHLMAAGAAGGIVFGGSEFKPGATIKITGPSSQVTAVASSIVVSPTGIAATLKVPAGARAGAYTAKITNPSGSVTTCSGCLTVIAAPRLTAISPNSVAQDSTRTVTLTGNGFAAAATLTGPTGVSFFDVKVVNSTTITAEIEIAGIAAKGSNLAIRVTNNAVSGYGSTVTNLLKIVAGAGGWHVTESLLPPTSPTAISCPTATTCIAVGWNSGYASYPSEIWLTSNGGTTWSSQVAPLGTGDLNGIACASASNCVAVGYDYLNGAGTIITSSDGGRNWSVESSPIQATSLNGVACPSVSVCFATGSSLIRTTNEGKSWTVLPTPAGMNSFDGIACPSVSSCLVGAGGTQSIVTSDEGSSWQVDTLPTGGGYIVGISCPATEACFAATSQGNVDLTTDGGGVWNVESGLPDVGTLTSISCSSELSCIAVGKTSTYSTGSIVRSTDGGARWTNQAFPAGAVELTGVKCPTSSKCLAVGSTSSETASILTTSDDGVAWIPQSVPVTSQGLSAVSCLADATCLVYGLEGPNIAVGTTFEPADGTSISCPGDSTETCFGATSSVTSATTNSGATWTTQPVPTFPQNVLLDDLSISCATTSVCFGVGEIGTGIESAILYGNAESEWSGEEVAVGGLDGLSCPATTSCYATSSTGSVIHLSGNGSLAGLTWDYTSGSPETPLSGIVCPGVSDCLVFGTGNDLDFTNDGGTNWTSGSTPSNVSYLNDIACSSLTDCVAVGQSTGSGVAVAIATSDGGAMWADQPLPKGLSSLSGVSCSSSDCVAVGQNSLGGGEILTIEEP
jgi:hypothetical protein